MPIYEYVCTACGHRLEVRQHLDDEPLKECPKCGKSTLKKAISAPHIQFKGKGFYETDYKQSKKPKSDKSNPSKKSGETCGSGCCSCCHKSKKSEKE